MPISLLDNLLGDWKKLLTDWAGSGTLTRAASEALLLKAEPALLKKLVAQWSHGDFSGLPPIVLLPASSMPGAAGAYAISTGTIYLNQDWLAGASAAQAIAVLTEELGHHLDGLLNVVDTVGDEGEYFSVFLREDELTDSQKEGLRAENDSVAIKVGNKTLEVEYAIQAPSIQPIKQFPKAGDNFARKSSSDGTYIYVPSITSGVASLSKYDLVGGLIWERNLDQGGGWPSSSAVASDGSILVATGSDRLVGKVSTLARFSSTGNKIWEVNNSNQRYGQDIAVEGNTVYVSGGTGAGFSNSNTAFVNAYSLSTGSTLWSKTYANSGAAFINDLEINNGKIYCSAALYGKVDLDTTIAGCLDLNGNEIWWRSAPAPDWNGISAIRVVGSQLIGTGYKADGGDRGDTRLISFNTSDGTILWDTSWGDNNQQGSGAIEVLNGKIYVAYGDGVPWNSSAASGGYSAVTELDTAGNLLNIYTYDVPNSYDGASELVKVGDSLFLLGQTTGAIAGQANGGGYDIYLASVVKAVAPVVTLAVSPATVTENGPSNLIYTFSRTGPTAAALTVNYSIAGTADATDYTGATPGTGKTISFAAGSATATLTIDPTADSTIEADETVALTLATGTGYTLGTATVVVGNITNDDIQSLRSQWLAYSSQATDEWSGGIAMFSNGDVATAFSVSKSNGSSSVIVQRLSTTGAILWSLDIDAGYTPSAGSILVGADDTIYVVGGTRTGATGESGKNDSDVFAAAITKAGQKLWYKNYGTGIHEIGSTAVLDANENILLEGRVSEVNDAYTFIKDVPNFYGAEFSGGWRGFQLRINPADGTVAKAYTTGSGNSGGGPIAIDRSRNIAFIAGYTFGAVNGVNTVGNGDPNGANTYLIARNESTGVILWTRMENWIRSNIISQGEENALYCVDKGSLEKINGTTGQTIWSKSILNADYILSSISGGGVILSESSSSGTLVIRRFDANGTENGSQVIAHTGQLFPRSFVEQGNGTIQVSGSTSGTITVPTGTIVTAQKQSGYDSFVLQFNSAFSDVPVGVPIITLIVSPASVTEDNTSNLLYTFTRTGPTSSALSVNYTVGGTATLGTDYTGILSTGTTKTISFAAGYATATLTIDPTADSIIEPNETVALTLAAGTGYTLGTATAVVGTITNDDFNSSPTALNISATNFAENIVAGSTVASLSTTDPDTGNTFTYALVAGTGSTNNTAFTISGNQLKINASPDFEAKSSYSIRVRSTDQGGLFFERNLVLAVSNLAEKVSASASTILAADKDTLELTGTRNIFGMGNRSDNWITGNSGRNKLTGGLGKDVLTGTGGVDTFFYGSLKESLLSGFDVITDYAAGKKIGLAFNFEGDDLIASAGSINALSATQISTLLTTAKFLANNAEALTVQSMSGTFVALNDAVAGFQAGNDALIHLSNYTIGVSNPVSII
ncbi:MAG TPA: hypothetical protein DDY43_13545 [Synechococcales bacterium UBA10510]|nr:hypothetical protein [Synechococcales bacterium UBA10510]